jgi:predicted enzyme related to lactoylglutathione lyase
MATTSVHDFCWFELATTRAADAKRFYADLFGWSYEGMPLPGGGEYNIVKRGDATVGAIYQQTPETGLGQMPPSWSAYVAVESADVATARAKELGGTALKEPFDVMDVGRMAVLRDPTGAIFNVWQATGPGPRAQLDYRAKGRVCWVECQTRGAKQASEFYASLFGWRIDADKPDYIQFFSGEAPLGGFFELTGKSHMDSIAPHWSLYFATDDVDASTAQLKQLGGRIYMPPMNLPGVGRFAVAADPQGAELTLFRLDDDH